MARLGLDDFVDETIVDGLGRGHEEVPVAVLFNLFHWLVCELRNVSVDLRSNKEDLLGLNFNISGLTPCAAQRLVNHDARVGQRSPLALGARAE